MSRKHKRNHEASNTSVPIRAEVPPPSSEIGQIVPVASERAFVHATARLSEPALPQSTPAPVTAVLTELDVATLETTPPANRGSRRKGAGRSRSNSSTPADAPPVEPVSPLEQVMENADKVARVVDDVRGEARELRQEVGDLSDLAARVDVLRNEVQEAEERLQRLSERREVDLLSDQVQELTGQVAPLQMHLKEANQVLERLCQQAEGVASRTAAQETELRNLRQQTQDQADLCAADRVRLRESFQELESALLERCTPLEERVRKIDSDLKEGGRSLQALREEIETSHRQIQAQNEELRAGQVLLQDLHGQIREAEELLEAIRREYWAARELPRPATPVPSPTVTPATPVSPSEVTPITPSQSITPSVTLTPAPLTAPATTATVEASDHTVAGQAHEEHSALATDSTPSDGRVLGVTVDHEGQIVEVSPGSPGERAGLVVGDRIAAVNGDPVSDGESLRDAVHHSEPGSDLKLQVRRGSESTEVTARIEPQRTHEYSMP
jgi:uncharacterized coiled-coil DUF342 family protein